MSGDWPVEMPRKTWVPCPGSGMYVEGRPPARAAGLPRTGRCPGCQDFYAVKRDGRLQAHFAVSPLFPTLP